MDLIVFLLALPKEVLALIVSNLDTNYYFPLALACKVLHSATNDILVKN